ncbi:MAG: DUF362 domain-containing protein [Candidatus Krumholzibacteria bacterium]|nr:DUF362 domain-containing protein [Candidatus Krumholzibacteria bacterium]
MKLDPENEGTDRWNPLRTIVRPGDRVVIKPNLLSHRHKDRHGDWKCVITHGSVIRAVLDYVMLALKGRGEVWITDGPQFDADWSAIVSMTGLDRILEYGKSFYGNVPVHVLDLRPEWWPDVREGVIGKRENLRGDPAGSQTIDVGPWSALGILPDEKSFHGSDYDEEETNRYHRHGAHEYLLSRTCTCADVIINIPKLKTHKKVGATLCLKNIVGINTGRNRLPHYINGVPRDHGDEFPDPTPGRALEQTWIRRFERGMLKHPGIVAPLFRASKRMGKYLFGDTRHVIRNGNWHGNDTCWRMVHDINACLLYSDGEHFPVQHPRRYLGIVDGIIGGEGNGPEAPEPVKAGFIIAGLNPVAVDSVSAWIMGFDPLKLAMIRNAFDRHDLPLAGFAYDDIRVVSNNPDLGGALRRLDPARSLKLKPHFGWSGHIELEP